MPDRSDSAATILSNALELPREARQAYVGRACAGNEGLRREVESLLSAYEAAGDTLDPNRARLDMQSAMAANDLPPGHRIGAYALKRLLATGGMGAVYLAERSDTQYEKRVAIKLVKPTLSGTEALLGRFRTERQVLASLDHPNIARLLDGGATEDGIPYIVMEYVDGQAIDSYCEERSLSIHERLRLFLAVCEAVGAAHRSLVVHRDLKPSNVLVNKEGEVKLLDFGLAKLLDEKAAPDQSVTRLRILTPRYASPEQVRGDSVTTATDVYSLGVLLYELVTGRLPYDGSTETDWEMERAICEKEPSPASSVVGDRASRRSLRGDLDAILATALSKNPSDRYASATELAADLRRHLTGLPVLARPDTIRYRTWMLVRRNKTLVAAVLSVIVALGVGLVLAMTQYWRAEERTEMAQRLAYSAAIAAAEGALRANQLQSAERFLAQAPLKLRGWEWSLIHRRLDQSSSAWQAHDHWVADLTITADGRRLVSGSYDGTVKIWEFPSGELVRTLALDSREADDEIVWEHGVLDLCLVPDGRTLVVGYVRQREEGNPIVWDMETGEVLGRGDRFLEWGQVAVHPREDLLAVGSLAGNVELTPIVDPRTSVETLHPAVVAGSHSESPQHRRVNALCFQPGGELLATGKYQVELWDAHTWERVAALPVMGYGVDRIAFSPDGRNLAADVSGGSIVVWDVTTGRAALTIGVQEEGVHALAYSVGGDEIYTAGDDGRLVAWDAETGSIRRVHRGHRAPVRSLALAPDGRRVASGDEQGVIRVWDMASGDVPTWYLEQDWRPRWALQACVTPDGRYALGPAANGGVLAWDFATHRVAGELSAFERCGLRSVVFSGDGKRMAVIHLSGAVTVLDVRDGDTAKLFLADRSDVVAAAAHPSRDLFVTAGTDSTVRVWSFDGGEEVSDPLHHAASPSSVCFTPDGSRLLVGDADGLVSLWSCASWRRIGHFVAAQQAVTDVAVSPDGHLVASVSLDGTTALRHLGDEEARIVLPDETVQAVTFTGAGGRLLAGAETGTLHVIDVSTGAQILQFDAHDRAILDLAYSSSGDMVISASRDGTLRTWASEAIESQHPSPFAGLTKGVTGAGRDSSRASGTQPANGTLVGSWTAALGTEEAVGAPGGRLENGASIETVSGRPAFHFDGPTEVLGVSDPPRCVPEAQAFTVMARVRPREGGSGTVLSCQRSSFDTSAGGWAVRVLDSVEKARSLVTYNRRIVELPLPSEDRFTHVAVTYEPGEETLSVFVDGVLAHSTRVPVEAMRSPDAPLRIGRAAYTSRLGFDAFAGFIDDVRVYTGTMSEEEIRKAMQASPSSQGAAAIVQDR